MPIYSNGGFTRRNIAVQMASESISQNKYIYNNLVDIANHKNLGPHS